MASGGSASANVVARNRRLKDGFIFEIADGGGKATVGSHVWVAEQPETEFEVESLGERLFLENARADHLAEDRYKHLVFARCQNVNLRNLRFLVQLLGAKLD